MSIESVIRSEAVRYVVEHDFHDGQQAAVREVVASLRTNPFVIAALTDREFPLATATVVAEALIEESEG